MPLKETETLELKRSTSELKEAIISISSMLNKHGTATLIFGIDDAGRVYGQSIGKKTLREISKSISDHIEPKVYPKIDEKEIDGKSCIQIDVQGVHAPYFAYGRAYMRTADEDRAVSARELEGLFVKKNKSSLSWDDKACPGAKEGDISPSKLRSFLKKASLPFVSMDVSLHNLGLMLPTGEITNAAILLFGREPIKFIRTAKLRCAVFIGGSTILDMKNYEGDFFTLIDAAEQYVLKNIHMSEVGLEGMRRIDKPEIDPSALREAIINAFCHRDYHIPDYVHVAVYQDRVEILSPGLLYGGLTIAKILKGGKSERRNELISSMLHRIHLIESWGRGIKLIRDKEPATEFEEAGRKFITIFKRKNVPEKVPKTADVKAPETIQKLSRNYHDNIMISRNYPVNIMKILGEIHENPRVTISALAKISGLSEIGVRYNLKKLKKEGVVKRVGPDRGGHWEMKEKPEKTGEKPTKKIPKKPVKKQVKN